MVEAHDDQSAEVETKDEKIESSEAHDSLEFLCYFCGKNLLNKESLSSHMEEYHRGEEKYKCYQCGCLFTDFKNMKQHIDHLHFNIKLYECKLCDYKSSRRFNLNKHIRLRHEKSNKKNL